MAERAYKQDDDKTASGGYCAPLSELEIAMQRALIAHRADVAAQIDLSDLVR